VADISERCESGRKQECKVDVREYESLTGTRKTSNIEERGKR